MGITGDSLISLQIRKHCIEKILHVKNDKNNLPELRIKEHMVAGTGH